MNFSEYRQYDALGLSQLIKAKKIKPEELLDLAIERAEQVNPKINALTQKWYDYSREMISRLSPNAPFAGIPFLIKDLSYHIQGRRLTKGSAGWQDYTSEKDSYLTEQLRKAGFLFMGRTNTPELGLAPFTEPEFYGPARNPWNVNKTAGGSSGGSGAAVAAGIVPIATASDGGGSIRVPASCNGLFGLKPSRGMLSLGPQTGEGWSGAVVEGCVSRSVRDTAAFLDACMGSFPGDPYIIQPPKERLLSQIQTAPRPLKIAYSIQHTLGGQIDQECVQAVHDAAKKLEALGHQVEEVNLPFQKEDLTKTFLYIVLTETAATVHELQEFLGRKIKVGKDVEANTYIQYLLGKTFSGMEYAVYKRRWNEISRRIADFHQNYDLTLTSVVALPPFDIGALQPSASEKRLVDFINTIKMGSLVRANIEQLADKIFQYIPYTAFANMTGQPAMSVPLHQTADGLPVGVMLTAAMGQDGLLLQLARQLEEAYPWFDKVPEV